jgi:cytochrome c556
MLKYSLTATVLLLGLATTAWAGAADDAIKGRQACMKANGGAMATFVPILKGEKPFDATAVKAATDSIDAACKGLADMWGADTQKGETAETWAKPEIWTDNATFKEAEAAYDKALVAIKASTDDASFKTAFGGFGGSCKGCHEKFRKPKE